MFITVITCWKIIAATYAIIVMIIRSVIHFRQIYNRTGCTGVPQCEESKEEGSNGANDAAKLGIYYCTYLNSSRHFLQA